MITTSDREPNFQLPPYTVHRRFSQLSEKIDWGVSLYGIPDLWQQSRGKGIKVAVLDTGVQLDHPDLEGAILTAFDFTRGRGGVADNDGHGTHVAGTIGARHNQTGVVGIAPECDLMIGKVLGPGGGDEQWIAEGIRWAAKNGADIISMSLGSPARSSIISEAIGYANLMGRFVICAAGNEGRANSVNWPAKENGTVAVGSVDKNGQVSRFSSRGEAVDIVAPGENILSTWTGSGYGTISGTSMATPFVSGVVTLMLAKHREYGGQTPVETITQLQDHLHKTATDAGPTGRDPSYGYGLIDPAKMLSPGLTDDKPDPELGGVWVFVPGGKVVANHESNE